MDGMRKRKMRFGENEIDVICRAEPTCGADDGAMADATASEILNRDTEKYELLSKRLGELSSASHDTVGWDVWEGATQLLCQHLVLHAELVHGKRVLELGAGVGVVGMIAAKCGAECVLLSDYDDGSLAIADANIVSNNLQHNCRTVKYDWSEDKPPHASNTRACQVTAPNSSNTLAWEVVLGSDLLYSSSMALKLYGAVSQILEASPTCRILISHQRRFSITWGPDRTPVQETTDTVLDTFVSLCASKSNIDALILEYGESVSVEGEAGHQTQSEHSRFSEGDVILLSLSTRMN